jgi:hypothetical protein
MLVARFASLNASTKQLITFGEQTPYFLMF